MSANKTTLNWLIAYTVRERLGKLVDSNPLLRGAVSKVITTREDGPAVSFNRQHRWYMHIEFNESSAIIFLDKNVFDYSDPAFPDNLIERVIHLCELLDE